MGFIVSIAEKITNQLVSNKIIKQNDKEIYSYGVECLISAILDVIITIIIGIVFRVFAEVLVFFTVFAILRQFTGGYHAKTYISCKLVYITTIFCVLGFARFIENHLNPLIIFFAFLFCILVMSKFAPIEDKNKPLLKEQKKFYRLLAIGVTVIGFILCFWFYYHNVHFCSIMLMSLLCITVMMLPPLIFKRKEFIR